MFDCKFAVMFGLDERFALRFVFRFIAATQE